MVDFILKLALCPNSGQLRKAKDVRKLLMARKDAALLHG